MSPRNARLTESGRLYAFKGRDYPSVTSILSAYPKPHLMAWYARMAAAEAMRLMRTYSASKDAILAAMGEAVLAHEATKTHQTRHRRTCDFVADAEKWIANAPIRYRDAAGARGTATHEAAERDDDIADVPENAKKRYESYRAWVDLYEPRMLAKEFQLVNTTDGYAGSADFIAEVDGVVYLVDIKTSGSLHHDMRLQLAAYRYAEFAFADDEVDFEATDALNRVERCALLHLTDDGHLFVDANVGPQTYRSFLDVKDVFHHVQTTENAMVGIPVPPPQKEKVA